jgi:hypothetical protein
LVQKPSASLHICWPARRIGGFTVPVLSGLSLNLGAGSGGPETYTGKDMMTAHKGMNISEQEYLAVMDDVVEALSKNKVGEDAVKDVIGILYSLKSQIIRA